MLYRTLKSLPTTKPVRTVRTARSFHSAIGNFVTLDSSGKLVTEKFKLTYGDSNKSYILMPPKIGYALQADSVSSNGTSFELDPDKHSLTYLFHKTKTFANESSVSLPRLEIPQELPRQTNTDKSPATLFLAGVSHEITLDGTPDSKFAEMAIGSYKRLKPSLDRLKDM